MPVERVVAILDEEHFFVRSKKDNDNNRLECPFFAHLELVQIYNSNSDILIVGLYVQHE